MGGSWFGQQSLAKLVEKTFAPNARDTFHNAHQKWCTLLNSERTLRFINNLNDIYDNLNGDAYTINPLRSDFEYSTSPDVHLFEISA